MLKAQAGQTAKVMPMTRVMREEAPDFKQQIKNLKSGIKTRQLEGRELTIQEKGSFAYIWARGSENFLAGMCLLESEGYKDVVFGAHEADGIFSATMIKKQYTAGTGAW
ncbi:MAG: hypothetical protein NTY33_00130 [Candidatus Moranbacteria bacterium]|nr:hypothetical protein [Candidatus Moranbacteria bacterium]